MVPFRILVATVLLVASSANGLITLLLDSVTYPAVADHHCLAALCSGLGFTSRDGGFHRATSTNYMTERRHAVGCQSSVKCASGLICDQIPYPETFDGGLGCYAQEWTSSGRPMDYLYSKSTHKCVPTAQQTAHTNARTAFYALLGIQNYQIFSIDVALIGTTGLPDPAAKYCTRFAKANALGTSFAPICSDAAKDGTSYALITSSQNTGSNRCPSRNYRRNVNLAERHETLVGRQTNTSAGVLNFTTLANGVKTISLFGNSSVGDQVWFWDGTQGKTTHVTNVQTQPWIAWVELGESIFCQFFPWFPTC